MTARRTRARRGTGRAGCRFRGLGLFDALLTLGLLAIVALSVGAVLDHYHYEHRTARAAARIALLSEAAHDHAADPARFQDLLERARRAPVTLPLATLRDAGALPAGFPDTSALGRDLAVAIRRIDANTLELLAGERLTPAQARDATPPPPSALLRLPPASRIGIVAPGTPARLSGPAIGADLAGFTARFPDRVRPGVIATLRRVDRATVIGPWLHRTAVPHHPEANRMEATLDMAGHDVQGAGAIAAERLTITDVLQAGTLTINRDLVIGQALTAEGGITALGTITAGDVSADTVFVTEKVTAPRGTISDLTVGGCTGC